MMHKKELRIIITLIFLIFASLTMISCSKEQLIVKDDDDNDGIPNEKDNCPLISNPEQEDLDNDSIGDLCDSDVDGDNIENNFDNCVKAFNPYQYDRDQDGKGYACEKNIFLRAGTFDPLTEEEKYIPNITTAKETGYFFLQFNENFDYAEIDSFLDSINAVNYDNFEGDVYIIKTNLTKEEIKSRQGVRAFGIYQPANRIEPELFLDRLIYPNGSLVDIKGDILLDIYTYSNTTGVNRRIKSLGGNITKISDYFLTARISKSKLIDLILIPDINLITPTPALVYSNEYAGQITKATEINEQFQLEGEGEIITIADSGLDTGVIESIHPDLRGRVIEINDMGTGIKKDLTGHGTHVSVIAAGNGKASNGRQKGAAPKAKIIFQSIGNEFPESFSSEDPLARQKGGTRPDAFYCFGKAEADPNEKKIIKRPYGAMGFAGIPLDYSLLLNGSSIHSNSWGSCQNQYTPRIAGIDRYLWNNKETVALFAAGNKADFTFLDKGKLMQRGGSSLNNAAMSKNAITVGATETSREINSANKNPAKIAIFSGKGDELSGRIKPDLVAPGTWILSARSKACIDGKKIRYVLKDEVIEKKVNFTHENCIGKGLPSSQKSKENKNYYYFDSGTSMATPHVAGLAALTKEYYKKIKKIERPSSALVKATLINGAEDLPDQDLGLIYDVENNISCRGYPNMCEGWGIVNIKESLFPGDSHNNLWFSDSERLDKKGDKKTFQIAFSKESPVRITLAWTDPPPESLQNDLDLEVVSPSGNFYLGNTFTEDGKQSKQNPLSKDPRLNNNVVEKVIIAKAEKGYYNISIAAKKLKSAGGQPFAVVASRWQGK